MKAGAGTGVGGLGFGGIGSATACGGAGFVAGLTASLIALAASL